jgi:hypothetical protein
LKKAFVVTTFSFMEKIYFILPALSLDGLLHFEVVENEITSDIFLPGVYSRVTSAFESMALR